MIYHFDPDFRNDKLDGKTRCCHCRRVVRPENSIPVSVNWDNWTLTLEHYTLPSEWTGDENIEWEAYVGETCFSKIEKGDLE